MKYMLLIYSDPAAGPAEGSPELEAEMGQWFQYTSELAEAGALVAGEGLQPTSTATTVRGAGSAATVTDGPFAETKEVLGGFYLIEVPDLDAALGWARRMPNIAYGAVEVRPAMVFDQG